LEVTLKKTQYIIGLALLWATHSQAQTDTLETVKSGKNPLIIELEVENGGIIASKEVKETAFQHAYYNGVNLKVGWKIQHSDDQYFKLYNNPI